MVRVNLQIKRKILDLLKNLENNCLSRTIFIKNSLMPMAISGHNGNNETRVGMSASIGLKFYDENVNEIEITQSVKPIDILIQRDQNTLNYTFEYVNATNIGLLPGLYLLQNSFKIKMNNASIHIEINPLNQTIGYLIVMKLGFMPILNSTSADYTSFKIFCPSKN